MSKIDTKLSPDESASIAALVYNLKHIESASTVFKRAGTVARDFNFGGSAQRFQAKAGILPLRGESGFGLMAMGQSGSRFDGQALLACRGTNDLKDVLTDISAGVQITSNGQRVHSGFQRTFRSFEKDIHQFIAMNQPKVIHCVGHSLGGALANLSANAIISKNNSPRVALYTYGAPRVGDANFANLLSFDNRIGADNIHRVYHGGDVVPMLPLWPFVHAPQPGGECYLGSAIHFTPWTHRMASYTNSVEGRTWENLRAPHPNIEDHVLSWIQEPLAFGGLNAYNIMMLGKAFQLAIRKVLTWGWETAGIAVYAGVSILDHLSYMLDSSAKASDENSTLISKILAHALRMCGVKTNKKEGITKQFIRYVLSVLMITMGRFVSMALRGNASKG